ncbi:hypothetical protein C1645_819331 [Glomus cerebriforme]|uniref:Pentacotripeptide-repeat region of PRORP domain-containing protein n=1 Tax=Glomus cerebriforme TaxID=658196 RepID=A0A397T5C8_9GLOM|nr:hypothetical protein C1645_819331 [Glomus cerebriforme]
MFKQIFNRPNKTILSSNFRTSKNYFFTKFSNRSDSYLFRNVIDKNFINNQNLFLFSKSQIGNNALSRKKQHTIEIIRFQSTIVNQQQQLETNSLIIIDQNKEILLLKGQNQSKMNDDSNNVLNSNHKIFEKSNVIANEPSNLLNEKEILDETKKNNTEKNMLDNNQQVLEKSMSFSNEDVYLESNDSLGYNKDARKDDDISTKIDIPTSKVLEKSISLSNENVNLKSIDSLGYDKDARQDDGVIPIPQFFLNEIVSLESSDSLGFNKDPRQDDGVAAKTEILTSNAKELYHPIIQTEGRDIDDIWNDYKNLTKEQFKTMTVKDFNNIIGAFRRFLKDSSVSDKSLVYGKILSIFEDLEGKAKLTPDVSTYNIFMSTALNLGDLSNLYSLFKVMKNRGIQPNTVSYNIMMSAFAKSGLRRNTYALHKEMVDLGIKRNKISYTILLSACAKDRHILDALQYYRMMSEEGIKPDVQIYNALLNVLINDADGNQIIKTYEEMKTQGIKPTVLTYNSLIRAMILRGEKEQAEKFYKEMESEGIHPNVLILDSMGITGFEAIQKLQDSNGKNLNLLDYNTLLRGCFRKSKYDDAFKIFNIMQENEVNPSLATYTILVGAYLQNNEIEKAMELFNKLKSDNVAPDSQIYTFMIDSLLKQKNVNETFNLLLEIKNLNDKIRFKKEEVVLLLDSASKLEDSKVVEKIFRTISDTESQLSNAAFERILWRVAQDENHKEKIGYYLKYMKKYNIPIRNTTYGAIIEGFIQKEDSKNTTDWYKRMIDDRFIPTGKTIFKTVQFLSKKNNIYSVLNYWNDFYYYGIRPGKEDFNFIIDYCCKNGKSNIVSEVFYQCRKMGFVPTNGNLLKIMQFYFKKSKVMKVVEYWDLFYVLKIQPRLDTINFMVDFCCTLKDKKLRSQILSQCNDVGYDAFSLYRLKISNKGIDEINSLLHEIGNTCNDSSETTSYEKNLEVIENWINSREKDYNALLNINKKLNLSEIDRLRRVLNIEERSIREREKLANFLQKNKSRLDPTAQKNLQSWTPYKKFEKSRRLSSDSKDAKDTNIEEINIENVESADILSDQDHDESLVESIIESTFRNVFEQNVEEEIKE